MKSSIQGIFEKIRSECHSLPAELAFVMGYTYCANQKTIGFSHHVQVFKSMLAHLLNGHLTEDDLVGFCGRLLAGQNEVLFDDMFTTTPEVKLSSQI